MAFERQKASSHMTSFRCASSKRTFLKKPTRYLYHRVLSYFIKKLSLHFSFKKEKKSFSLHSLKRVTWTWGLRLRSLRLRLLLLLERIFYTLKDLGNFFPIFSPVSSLIYLFNFLAKDFPKKLVAEIFLPAILFWKRRKICCVCVGASFLPKLILWRGLHILPWKKKIE